MLIPQPFEDTHHRMPLLRRIALVLPQDLFDDVVKRSQSRSRLRLPPGIRLRLAIAAEHFPHLAAGMLKRSGDLANAHPVARCTPDATIIVHRKHLRLRRCPKNDSMRRSQRRVHFRCTSPHPGGSRFPEHLQPYLDDAKWNRIHDLFPEPKMTAAGGRPPVPPRQCLEGVLWVLVSGARWQDLPERYPSPATCWRRLKAWTEAGIFREAWLRLLKELDEFRKIDLEEAIADGTFSPAKKGAPRSARRRKAKAQKSCC